MGSNVENQLEQWRQGSFISVASFVKSHPSLKKSTLNNAGPDDLLLLTPFDCSIVKPNLVDQPYTRVIVANKVSSSDVTKRNLKNYYKGRNPYKLLIDFGVEEYLLIDVSSETIIDRKLFLGLDPAGILPVEVKRTLSRWLSNYYTWPALPDNFVERFSKFKDKIQDKLKKNKVVCDLLERTYISIDPKMEELPSTQDYMAQILLAMDTNKFDIDETQTELLRFLNELLAAEKNNKQKLENPKESIILKKGSKDLGFIQIELVCQTIDEITIGEIVDNDFIEMTWFDYFSEQGLSEEQKSSTATKQDKNPLSFLKSIFTRF